MVTLELIELTAEYVRYKFFPEGKEDNFGIIQVSLKDLSRALIKYAENVSSCYKGQAWAQVERLILRKCLSQKSAAAWC